MDELFYQWAKYHENHFKKQDILLEIIDHSEEKGSGISCSEEFEKIENSLLKLPHGGHLCISRP